MRRAGLAPWIAALPVVAACQPTSSDESLLGYALLLGFFVAAAVAIASATLLLGAVGLLVGSTSLTVHWLRPSPITRAACAVVGVGELVLSLALAAALVGLFGATSEACATLAWVVPLVGLGVWNLAAAARGGVEPPTPAPG